ncbi:hypothetical protein Hypma_002849 [Hypsizygus marmoreus]|uniref:Intradiol ring-cleavage dioxygenases domain-containing protein n=1 Tax=Hypsizygus marmoreus TaxID=39966 RepID=A0A369JB06_HYPMA|nr:hypothetical protein Hypma_002849 [Hypsizygus marmoreus]
MRFANLISFIALAAAFVAGHPGEVHDRVSVDDIARRELETAARYLQARKCAAEIAEFEAGRMRKRDALMKRQTPTSSAASPHYTSIQNSTCITAPEVTEGPYYINNEYVRTDLTETQPGVKLVLDIGVIDTSTCKPLNNVFVELWAANATGVYGGYNNGGATAFKKETFLRGGYFTNAKGIVEITTIYPGFYQGRTAHIHTMLHNNWVKSANGTLVSHAGSVVHIGQFFFAETWNDKVFSTSPYTTNKQTRTLSSQDSILSQANSGGNNAFINLRLLRSTLSQGILGYITLGIDSRKAYSIQNTNYFGV